MKVVSCNPDQMEISPHTFNACTFNIIDKWDPKQYAKTCDTMFYLRDGTGAYVWDCDQWIFLDFSGYTAPDWNAKENQQGHIKNKPFEKLGKFLEVSNDGVLSVSITPADIGAATKNDFDNHKNDKNNPHGVTATQVGAYSKTESDGKFAKKEDLTSHVSNKENPHEVTAHQVGALTAEESFANVVDQIIGKENAKINITLDYQNKIAGSVVENPHKSAAGFSSVIPMPAQVTGEVSQNAYNALSALDGDVTSPYTTTNKDMTYFLVQWNVLEALERELGSKFFTDRGATTTKEKVKIAKEILIGINPVFWGYGKSPSGNKLNFKIWINNSSWAGTRSHNASSVTKMEYNSTGTSTNNYLSDDGYLYASAYAEPSDGAIASTVVGDYAQLNLEIEISANDHIESKISAYHGANPPSWKYVEEKPFETLGDNLEVVDGKLNASGGIAASQIEVNEGNIPDKYISPKTLAEWENEQLLKRGKQMVLGENRQLESPSDMNFGKFGISDNYKSGTFKNEQPYFTVDEAGDVTVVKAGQYLISGICKRQYKRLVSIWHYISLIHKDVTSGNETQLDLFPLGGSVQNRNKQYGQTVRQCKVGDKIWMSSTSSAGPGNANADALQYLNVDFFTMERLGD